MFEEANEAFTRQSEVFDDYEERNEILKWMRSVTQSHVLRHLKEKDVILELNSGTGIDAIFFGLKGFRIHCTDISGGMIKKLSEKIRKQMKFTIELERKYCLLKNAFFLLNLNLRILRAN